MEGCQGLGRELGIVLGMGSYGIMPLPWSFIPRTELWSLELLPRPLWGQFLFKEELISPLIMGTSNLQQLWAPRARRAKGICTQTIPVPQML